MKKMSALAVLAIMALATGALAQEPPRVAIEMDTVYVTAEGTFEAPPDTAVITMTVSAQEATSSGAYERTAKAAEAVREALRATGLDPKQAQIGHYALQAIRDYKSPRQRVVAYRVSTHVTVELTDFSKIGPLIERLSAIQDSEGQSVSYKLEKMEAAKDRAVQNAFAKARSAAATIVQAGGRALGELAYASVDTFEQPMPMMQMTMRAQAGMPEAAMDAPTEGFTPQKITVNARVTALFRMR